ncbi:MAG: VWA domain-containing protein [Planctomycetota bacterium]|nr:VWA domain-containing protein [Planctomycetota bacterium]
MRVGLMGMAGIVLAAVCALHGNEVATASVPARHARRITANVVVPQSRAFSVDRPQAAPVKITEVLAAVVIEEQVATTTLDVLLANGADARQEAEVLLPVPEGAVVRGFTFQGAASEPTAELLRKEEARRIYDEIVRQVRDPALLEFAGYNLIRSSVFPVEARGTQRVRLTYEQVLPADGKRVDYVLPRSESLAYAVPWKISARIRGKAALSTVYSPSHRIESARDASGALRVGLDEAAARDPGPFRLSYLLGGEGVAASLLAYPDPKGAGGYFLLLAGLPEKSGQEPAIRREVTLVLDRSGSMNGDKMEQVREAAQQIVAGLDAGEYFNLIVYNEGVESFAEAPVAKTKETGAAARAFLQALTPRGGTNIHDALAEALRPKPAEGCLPLVLFLTDGLPTIGQTRESVIRELAAKANPHQRRVFTFGVGVDVNTPLLQRISSETRAASFFVLPKEDVEVKVGQVFQRLKGPALASPELRVVDEHGQPAPGRTLDLLPAKLPDLFEGDQLVLMGRYTGTEPLRFQLSGNFRGAPRTFAFRFDLGHASVKNAYVPRLWASRKIGVLVDAIRQMGADQDPVAPAADPERDPRFKELVDEVVRLSKEFGILTEYTAFLAREGTDLGAEGALRAEAIGNMHARALNTRSGWGSVNQETNLSAQKMQSCMNYGNEFYDQNMNRVAISSVQQVADRTFYQRRGRWVDGEVVGKDGEAKPDLVVKYGSAEFDELVETLARKGRQGALAVGNDVILREELGGEIKNIQVSW